MIKSWAISDFSLCHRFLPVNSLSLSTNLSTGFVDNGERLATRAGTGYALAPVPPSGLTENIVIEP